MKSIVIAGSLAQKPGRGGHSWVFLQYLLGFRTLGWDVVFLDRLEPDMCVDEAGAPSSIERSTNLQYFLDLMRRFGFEGRYGLLCGGNRTIGLSRSEILERVADSAALLNITGFMNDPEVLAAAPTRIFLDIDPGFAQMWQALGLHDGFAGHDAFVTIAEAIGNGWSLVEPRAAVGDPWRYRDYIRRSAAELMVAKGTYVQTRRGWFSDRSICYLASGRPVLAQDTGFSETLPTGEGLLAFETVEQAADAARAVARDYARHQSAARKLAETYFDSSSVLGTLAGKLGLC